MQGSKISASKEIVFIEIKHFFNSKLDKLLKSYLIYAVYLKIWTVSEENSMEFKTKNKGCLAVVDLVIKSLHHKGKGFSKLFKWNRNIYMHFLVLCWVVLMQFMVARYANYYRKLTGIRWVSFKAGRLSKLSKLLGKLGRGVNFRVTIGIIRARWKSRKINKNITNKYY